jgi:hypothetical protein
MIDLATTAESDEEEDPDARQTDAVGVKTWSLIVVGRNLGRNRPGTTTGGSN